MVVRALHKEIEGAQYRLRGLAQIETSEMLLKADEIDYNEDTKDAEARGNVYFLHYRQGEELYASRVEYNLREQSGVFYDPRGSSPAKIEARPGVLTTSSPFSFQGEWAERNKNRYTLYNGFITNCKLPNPAWIFQGPKFEVTPGERALAYRSVFRLKKIPLFYAPMFYKSLESMPRKSGFLQPSIGNSSRRGKMLGAGYYWAINRSYDATYRSQFFTQRGFAHHVDVRGKPSEKADFNFILYGVNDRGELLESGERGRKQSGVLMTFDGRWDMPRGFTARGEFNYLSSFDFRQAFTESFYEAIFSEVHSIGFVTRQWSSFSARLVAERYENFQSTQPDDKISIRKLPEVQFVTRDRRLLKNLPVWVSLESSAGLVRRNQPLFQTRQYLERMDLAPRLMTALRWKGVNLIPSVMVRETHYGEQRDGDRISGENINRHAREFALEVIPPSLARVRDGPSWMGEKVKHIIEPRAAFRHTRGVEDFDKLIRFDELELLSNTTEAEISVTNRLLAKRGGVLNEVLSWQLLHKRYFDPDFGGAVVEGRRNVVRSVADMTGYTFLSGPRRYSPIISSIRVSPKPGLAVVWRSDYDPLYGKLVNSGVTGELRYARYSLSAGHHRVACIAVIRLEQDHCTQSGTQALTPPSHQVSWLAGFGHEHRRGWTAAFTAVYDFREDRMQYATTQVTYNTDCCGFSVQYRRFSFGSRNENQFRAAFAIANIGSFGTLKKQERIF
jgi:LPS-assembly protein